jgi:hypothetical protein
MKKTIVIIILFICAISIQAQTENIDNKLLAKYSKKELRILKTDNPSEYEFAKYCVNNAFYIAPSSEDKIAGNSDRYGKIKIKELSEVNFFELNIELKQRNNQVFVITKTLKVLVIKSKDQIIRELKNK